MTDVTQVCKLEDLEVPALEFPAHARGGGLTHDFAPTEEPSVED